MRDQRNVQFSTRAGCTLGTVFLLVVSTLVCLFVYTGWRQNREIDKFASAEALVFKPQFSAPEQVTATRERFAMFGREVIANRASEIQLSTQDLNDLLGHEPKLFEIRDMIHFTDIKDTVVARISFPMRTFRRGTFRYLNGTAEFLPVIEKGIIKLNVVSVNSDRGAVPDGFTEMLSESNLLHPYREDEELNPIIERITSTTVQDGKVVLRSDPAKRAPK